MPSKRRREGKRIDTNVKIAFVYDYGNFHISLLPILLKAKPL